jgi:hypothetical protein
VNGSRCLGGADQAGHPAPIFSQTALSHRGNSEHAAASEQVSELGFCLGGGERDVSKGADSEYDESVGEHCDSTWWGTDGRNGRGPIAAPHIPLRYSTKSLFWALLRSRLNCTS